MKSSIPITHILGSPITSLRLEEQISLILTWAKRHKSKVVYLANSHMLMEAHWNQNFAQILARADIVSPDGMPLVWILRLMGIRNQNRVAGMDIFINLCRLASVVNVSVFFLGSEATILGLMRKKLEKEFPFLSIAGMEPLPFRPSTPEEDRAIIEKINSSNAGLIFVCLGCPKQENWMAQHKDKVNGVMIGVGAVFAVYAGLKKRAPRWIREHGLEWLYRLVQEPRRLWRRYGTTIPPFMYLAIKELLSPCKSRLRRVKQNLAQEWVQENVVLDIQNIDTKSSSKIGEILVKQNILTENFLEAALQEQKTKPGVKLGEILVDNNFISPPQLQYYLDNQKVKLGKIMVEKRMISPTRLRRVLNYQAVHGGLLGEIMLEKKLITSENLNYLLIEQYWRKNFGSPFIKN